MPDIDIVGFEVSQGRVLEEWIDINDHMNVAYYVLAFDLAVDALWDRFGITSDHVRTTNSSTFAVESHVTYQRELKLHDPYRITTEVLAFDEKRIHQFMRMYHAEHGHIAATAEWLNLHVDLTRRRVAPWPETILASIRRFAEQQGKRRYPFEAGRQMRIARPLFTVGECSDE